MEFDVIITNPPYHLPAAGNSNQAHVKPLYHQFVEKAMKLRPRYLSMIIPSRWFSSGWGLDDFRAHMITDRRLVELHDHVEASDCFPDVEIKGGICYFLWDRQADRDCHVVTHKGMKIISDVVRPLKEEGCDILIRDNDAIPIFRKVRDRHEITFDTLVSTKKPFGFSTNYDGAHTDMQPGDIKLYAKKKTEYVRLSEIRRNVDAVNKHKVIAPKAVGSGNSASDVIKPLYCEPGAVCTETYLLVGPFDTKETAENVIAYFETRFFHFLVSLQKITQNCTKKVYRFVPVQDFSIRWTDDMLYRKYGLSSEEIRHIESTIWPGRNYT